MSCGIGPRPGIAVAVETDLWRAATAPTEPLAWKLPYATGEAIKSKKKKVLSLVPDWSSLQGGPSHPSPLQGLKSRRVPLLRVLISRLEAGKGVLQTVYPLSAACLCLTHKECITYYLEKLYQREVVLRNMIVSIQNLPFTAGPGNETDQSLLHFWEEKNTVAVILQQSVYWMILYN